MSRSPIAQVALLVCLAGGAAADTVETTWKVDPDVRVEIHINRGRIEVEAWERSEARLEAKGDTLSVEASTDRISIGQPGPGWFNLPFPVGRAKARMKLRVPVGCSLSTTTFEGRISVEGVEGELRLRTVNGSIDVEGAASEANLETVSGSIDFEGEHSRVRARTISGSIELAGVEGEVDASTLSGSIDVEASIIERADLNTVSGRIELETRLAPGARVTGKSHSGSIRLVLPEDTSARFRVETFSGSIRNELGDERSTRSRYGPGRHLEFVAGDGDGRVTLDAFSSSVSIEKR